MRTASKLAIAKPRRLQKNEIELLKRTVAKGVSDDEFALFLWVCKKHKVDPLTRQVHCVRRWLNKHHQDEKNIWVGGFQMTIQMGIDGYRALAGRDHADFGGCDEPEFEFEGNQKKIPSLARIRLWKKGLEHPIVGVAYWDEYAPKDLTKAEAFFWAKMPKHMLAKCAEALALRKGYPELADIYTNEEMAQTADEFTPEGRQIASEERSIPAELVSETGHIKGSLRDEQAKAALARVEAADKELAKKKSEGTENLKPKGNSLKKQEAVAVPLGTLWPMGPKHSTEGVR